MIDKSILLSHTQPVQDVVRFLDSSHLPVHLQAIPQMFERLAQDFLRLVPSSPETTKAVQKLVEAKDQAIRAQIHADENNIWHELPKVSSGTVQPAEEHPRDESEPHHNQD